MDVTLELPVLERGLLLSWLVVKVLGMSHIWNAWLPPQAS